MAPKKKPPDFADAIGKYKEFYEFDPRSAGVMNLVIPATAYYQGSAHTVRYESDKWEKKKNSYYHEHDRGVGVYVPAKRGERGDTQVPGYIREAKTLVKLGGFLGLDYIQEGEGWEAPGGRSDELYTIPSGKALIVVSGKRTLKALIWGGRLDVLASGINH